MNTLPHSGFAPPVATLIVPGYLGSGDGHWQRIWADEDPDALLVEQADFDRPARTAWLAALDAAIAANPGAVLVAHSLGCILIAHYARLRPQAAIAGALLVAPADVEAVLGDYPQFASFAPVPRLPLPFPATLVASRNDPFMDFSRARRFASAWGARLVDLGEAGHVNVASGHGVFPEARQLANALRTPTSASGAERRLSAAGAASVLG
ncbi:alpha/beta hydrolase [Methylobrevis albus]|uniref:Alpha/beta hydrolase n=1 Tax=Methylobrevis albus TaxID=2793297 RepID=A0A931HZC2_9HYPH|nr:alpha/beta hydrolase [Methylobrevis albus]MBH0236877.1 alpha/beta hydrolase [Methylobrevis albus]